jgi:hypothetical protein
MPHLHVKDKEAALFYAGENKKIKVGLIAESGGCLAESLAKL